MIRPRGRAGYKLIELVVVMGILMALIGFSTQILLRLQSNAERQQTWARGGVAVEQLLSALRADIQSAQRVEADRAGLTVQGVSGVVVYRHWPEKGLVTRQAGDTRTFQLPRGATVRFDYVPSVRRLRLVTVRVEASSPGFRQPKSLRATMVAALRGR